MYRRVVVVAVIVAAGCDLDLERFDPVADGAPPDGEQPGGVELVVTPVYPANARWNDYVRNAEPERGPYAQAERACDGSETGGYDACIHGGERRKVIAPGRSSCEGLTIADALDAFEWECIVAGGTATFFTRGLQPERGLSDLLEATAWKANHVTIRHDGALMGESRSEPWWTNPVEPLPDNPAGSGAAFLDHPSAIYVLDATRSTDGYHIGADGVGLAMLEGAELRWAGSSTPNCDWSANPSGEPDALKCLVAARRVRFLWLEGTFDAQGGTGADRSIVLSSVAFSQVRRARIRGGLHQGLQLQATHNSCAYDVEVTGAGTGVYVRESSSHNTLERVVVHGNTGAGFACSTTEGLPPAEHNTVRNLVAHSNGDHGVSFNNHCPFAVIRDVLTYGNADYGLWINGSSTDARITRIIAANNGPRGILVSGTRTMVSDATVFNNGEYGLISYADDATYTRITSFANAPVTVPTGRGNRVTMSHVTTVNNVYHGVWLSGGVGATFVQVLAVNNAAAGVRVSVDASDALFAQIATSNNVGDGITISSGSTGHRFTAALLVGPQGVARCAVGAGGEGLVDGGCSVTGADGSRIDAHGSDATLRVDGIDAMSSLVGRVDGDARNASDAMGVAPFTSIEDWVTFEHRLRGWGRESPDPFPGASHTGRCDAGTCRIWDLRLRATDTVFRNTSGDGRTRNEPFVTGEPCPSAVHGDRAITDQQTTPNTFLVNALEILDDDVEGDDDDGLCESGEACIYSPNFGAYQGEGDYVEGGTCVFENGIVSDVTMYGHPVNGG